MAKYKKLWGIFFTFLFLWLALRKIDLQTMLGVFATINPTYLLLYLFSYTVELLTRTHRWMEIQPRKEMNFKYSFFGVVLGYFFNNVLPARAGDLFRPYYFAKKQLAASGETLGAVVLERFFDGVMLLGMILISFQQFPHNELLQKAGIVAGIFYFIILVGILLAILKRETYEKIIKFCLKFLPNKINSFFLNISMKFADGLNTIKDFKRLTMILVSSAFCWLSSVTSMWICFKAFGFEGNFITASFVITILSLSSLIPASPGNLGVYEYFCILLISNILGHTKEEGAAFSMVMHGLSYLYILAAGIIIIFIEGIKINDITSKKSEN